ncbi:hypothetical protein RDI58_020235 [Solanum bulbocastanum]|uniref:Profilin n=1 Tax=Solanum bulbocastanum TaxID=147425 RepID=A0AAN8Y7N1_SOLBU
MSWQTYVDEHLLCEIEGNHLTSAAIIGQDGTVWAQSANFPQFKPEEITGIMNDFAEPGTLAPTGLYLGGTKYMVIQGEPGAVIRGKKGPGGWVTILLNKVSRHIVYCCHPYIVVAVNKSSCVLFTEKFVVINCSIIVFLCSMFLLR